MTGEGPDNAGPLLVLKNLQRRPVRTLLSILGVAIGIAAIIAFHAVARGFKEGLSRYMRASGAEMLVVNKMVLAPEYSRIAREEQEFIRAVPGVEHLSAATFTLASPRGLKVKTAMPALVVFGRTPGDRLIERFRASIDGRIMERDDEVMLGSIAAQNLGIRPGAPIELFGRPFTVVGVYESDIEFERVGAIVSNAVVQRELKMGEAIAMGFLYLKDGAAWEQVKRAIEEKHTHLQAIRTGEFTAYYNQLDYIDWFVWIVSLVSVVIGSLGVLNTLLMSVSERTREIGTLRALGWSRSRVLRLILGEGIILSVVGGALGLVVGSLGAEILIRWAPRGFLDTEYSLMLFVQAMGVALGLGLAGALYPAWRAGRLSPIEALKYE